MENIFVMPPYAHSTQGGDKVPFYYRHPTRTLTCSLCVQALNQRVVFVHPSHNFIFAPSLLTILSTVVGLSLFVCLVRKYCND